jgi:accessory gene regulator B
MGHHTAEKLGRLVGLNSEDIEVVAYGIDYLLAGLLGLILVISMGLVLNLMQETIAVMLGWGLLRFFAGGAHCTALWRCNVASLIGILVAVIIARSIPFLMGPLIWIVICSVWVLLAVWLWAPINSERSFNDPRKREYMRKRAIITMLLAVSILFYLAYSGNEQVQLLAVAGASGLAAGAIMLSYPGFWLIKLFDQIMQNLQYKFNLKRKGGETR